MMKFDAAGCYSPKGRIRRRKGTMVTIFLLEKTIAERERYILALHRAIEARYKGEEVPPEVFKECPFHAKKLNKSLPLS